MNMSKCEYLIVRRNEINDLNVNTDRIKRVETSKYLNVFFNRKGNSKYEIQDRINKGRKVIRTLNSLLWNRTTRKDMKKHIYKNVVLSVILYDSEV